MSIVILCNIFPVYTVHIAEPPRITSHPQELKDAVPGKPVMFTAEATGMEPLNYQWWHSKLAGDGGRSREWQPCPAEWSDGATLTIPSVQKSSEGRYCCVISNYAGEQASNPAQLSVGKNLTIICYAGCMYEVCVTPTSHILF